MALNNIFGTHRGRMMELENMTRLLTSGNEKIDKFVKELPGKEDF
jgi:hypothetical protein